ncbi:MAG TPA: hypothetical protein VKJ00_07875 [Thermoanaerobaculia bacterium]|nr:hypothetical protein [Thermoanaerobaculia bacterium]HMF09037.1 hypothetical protein [Thermoanaerobaculia bacterium]
MSGAALKNPAELPARLELTAAPRVLLVDAPPAFVDLLRSSRFAGAVTEAATGEELSSVKEAFDAVVLWRESRVGSRSALDAALRRLDPGGVLWVVIAMRKVRGPETPAAHRLELPDLSKGLEKHGMAADKEVRVTSWHVAHRFAYSR